MMQIARVKLFAYTGFQKNEKGFTFITSLMMLSIFILTIPLLSHILLIAKPNTFYNDLSVHEFFRIMRDEIIVSSSFSIYNDDHLLLVQEGDVVAISQYENIIRRRLNGKGHLVYLQDVEDFQVEESDFGVHLIVTDRKGITYEKTFVFYEE